MKVLSIRQPWASLIAYGYKEYEFRTWKTKYRGEFLIHASKMVEKENMDRFKHLNIPFETGAIIAKGYIDDCVLAKDIEDELIKKDSIVYGQSRNREGYAFHIKNIELVKPIKTNGKLGFWEYKEEKS